MLRTRKQNLYQTFFSVLVLGCIFFSCTDDQKISKQPVSADYISEAKKVLQDSIVFNARAMMGTVNKTQLPQGCPMKYHFSWNGDILNMKINKFTVGTMPVTMWFSINLKFMRLNSWEKNEYPGDEWMKFEGNGGLVKYTANGIDPSYDDGDGGAGTVTGYFNYKTMEIEFVTSFNVLNVTSDVFKQKIDKSRIAHFDEDFAKFERDLEKYKKDNGL
ncbi:DUF4903 family protein [Porphyromonas pogonae]|uniref:DUF4903 family protein n=1 Tax=Porphyromonas pogonae TaxID=867595 RepID=UPI002E76DCCD|nr:DUF4903 family protein [Porphyromonas pogonae]